jgi:hypothetical protein
VRTTPGCHEQKSDAGFSVSGMPDSATTPEPIFTAEEGLGELWVKAYQGEVLGELLFGGIAEQLADPDQAAKLRVVATLERRTKEATAPALERAGISTDPDPEMQVLASVLIPGALEMTWSDLMGTIGPITEQYVPLYQRIGELSPAERETADLLVAHEVALRTFAAAEVAGDRAGSLTSIEALAHMA